MEEENKPLEGQVCFDDLGDIKPLEPLDGVDILTPKKPDDYLADYTNVAKDTLAVLEEIEKFKEAHREVFNAYQDLLDKIENNNNIQTQIKDDLTQSMEDYNISTIGNDMFKATFIASTTRNTFDTTKFKKEHEDLYKDYVKTSNVKAYVKISEKV